MDDRATMTMPVDGWRAREEVMQIRGKTFFLASRFLPRTRRLGVFATYAFCRVADDIVDAAPLSGLDAAAGALDRWEQEILSPVDPIARTFAAARDQFAIPLQPAHDLIAGIRIDLAPRRYATWAELRQYCYLVAGTVGLMVAPVLGCRDPRALARAADLGIAMQLTNILRDIGEDARADRLYLPLDEILDFGCDPDAILAGRPGPRFPDLMAFEIARARRLYDRALDGTAALPPRSRFTARAAGRLYGRILNEIEDGGYEVFQARARVSTRRKALAMPGLLLALARSSISPVPFSLDDGPSYSLIEE